MFAKIWLIVTDVFDILDIAYRLGKKTSAIGE
jgi:hypothetical protein